MRCNGAASARLSGSRHAICATQLQHLYAKSLLIWTRRSCGLCSCQLVPLDENPGVRPIGICEPLRRIVGKAIMVIAAPAIQEVAGSLQLCSGQHGGCEAAARAIRTMFAAEETDGVLLVDATNAFNSLNRSVALPNTQRLCPTIAPTLINTYRGQAELFVMGKVILSREGTTQGDPLAMAMYALAVVPPLRSIRIVGAAQVWLAEDASASAYLDSLRQWWDALVDKGPAYGYFPNAPKKRGWL